MKKRSKVSDFSDSEIFHQLGDTYKGKKVLITGHTGFKGSWLSLWISFFEASITGFALDPPTSPSLFEVAGIGNLIDDLRGDIRDFNLLETKIRQLEPEIIFHLAAQPLVLQSYQEPKETFDVNVLGTVNLLEIVRSVTSVKAILVVTSDKCYENTGGDYSYRENDPLGGHDPYSASKAAAEIICTAYRKSFFNASGVNLATARSGNVIGGGDWAKDRIVPDAIRAIESGEPIPVRNPGSVRPWQHVLEPTFGYLLLGMYLLEKKADNSLNPFVGAWNFGSERNCCLTVQELVEKLIPAYGKGKWINCSGHNSQAGHEAKVLTIAFDKAYKYLGWHPRWPVDKAVDLTVNWYKSFYDGASSRELCLNDIKNFMGQL